jgi:hypothetical protein
LKNYLLLYKVSYKHNPMWSYKRFSVKATNIAEAKAIVRKNHPKATMLSFVEVLSQKSIKRKCAK